MLEINVEDSEDPREEEGEEEEPLRMLLKPQRSRLLEIFSLDLEELLFTPEIRKEFLETILLAAGLEREMVGENDPPCRGAGEGDGMNFYFQSRKSSFLKRVLIPWKTRNVCSPAVDV